MFEAVYLETNQQVLAQLRRSTDPGHTSWALTASGSLMLGRTGGVSSMDAGSVSITRYVLGVPLTSTVPTVAVGVPAVIVNPSALLLIMTDV